MSQVIRAQYRAVIQKEAVPEKTEQAFAYWEEQLKKQCLEGGVLTGTMCRYQDQLFLYLECIAAEEQLADSRRWKAKIENFAQNILGNQDVLEMWPVFDVSGEHKTSETGRFWVYMYPVFWFDEPKSLDTWRRTQKPDGRCGRIAVLHSEKLFSYVCHHQAIGEEGLLVGDRYQMISQHENLLFSYFETPRDREQVNISRKQEVSEEIKKWEAVDPESHFYHFPEAHGENFLVIPTVFSVES